MEGPQALGGPGAAENANNYVQVLCCVCGIPIAPNAANTCASCLASSSDITRGISTEVTLHQCRGCQRWHKEAGKWIACELESRELMALCLGNVSGLKTTKGSGQKVRLVDAAWIWTEPHSMRLKVRLTIQKEVQQGTILQQSFTVVFIVRNQQCIECQAEFRQGSWKSLVQVRQRVAHKRTFLYLEQLILKHGAHRGCLSIETFRDGMDFYFPDKGKAARFISFLENVVPTKMKTSKKLIGTDDKSNVSNFKYTSLVEICPLCKDDLLYLPVKTARNLGNINRLVMVKAISNVIHLIDPLSGQTAQLSGDAFWRDPLRPIITAARSRMTRFVVLGKEPVLLRPNVSKRSATRKQKSRLANLTLAREDDLGVNDRQFEERSSVGYLMKSGDVCVGYDLTETQFVDDEAERMRSSGKLPDVVVIRKLYGGVAAGEADASKKRLWKLKRLEVEKAEKSARAARQDAEADDMDEEDFMREVEADRDMRSQINLYKSELLKKKNDKSNPDVMSDVVENNDEEDEDDQEVKLDELLDALAMDGPDPEDIGNVEVEVSGFEEGGKAAMDGIAYVGREEARQIKDKEGAVPQAEFRKHYDFDPDL
ncbi:NMD3 family protein [Nitzschia inconspicua]|uniref:60S ribosomal export protein NMD3 n=1 Tax=Nitzschia inconspicua TaxID=303405 RepID=A0A9K3PGJ1_9STRA|nr:NMD3 family protein [Nitzschia inconspicua]